MSLTLLAKFVFSLFILSIVLDYYFVVIYLSTHRNSRLDCHRPSRRVCVLAPRKSIHDPLDHFHIHSVSFHNIIHTQLSHPINPFSKNSLLSPLIYHKRGHIVESYRFDKESNTAKGSGLVFMNLFLSKGTRMKGIIPFDLSKSEILNSTSFGRPKEVDLAQKEEFRVSKSPPKCTYIKYISEKTCEFNFYSYPGHRNLQTIWRM